MEAKEKKLVGKRDDEGQEEDEVEEDNTCAGCCGFSPSFYVFHI